MSQELLGKEKAIWEAGYMQGKLDSRAPASEPLALREALERLLAEEDAFTQDHTHYPTLGSWGIARNEARDAIAASKEKKPKLDPAPRYDAVYEQGLKNMNEREQA